MTLSSRSLELQISEPSPQTQRNLEFIWVLPVSKLASCCGVYRPLRPVSLGPRDHKLWTWLTLKGSPGHSRLDTGHLILDPFWDLDASAQPDCSAGFPLLPTSKVSPLAPGLQRLWQAQGAGLPDTKQIAPSQFSLYHWPQHSLTCSSVSSSEELNSAESWNAQVCFKASTCHTFNKWVLFLFAEGSPIP